MATYVLVHGGWTGGWLWRKVATHLRAAGHDVYTPTLTGLGERVHLASPDIDLETHIQDILMVLDYEELRDVILVGYSYSGMVVTAVAERAPERLAHLVYLDAFVPGDGDSLASIIGPELTAFLEQVAVIMATAGDFPTIRPMHRDARRSRSSRCTRRWPWQIPRRPSRARSSIARTKRELWGRWELPSPRLPHAPRMIAGAIVS